MRPAPGWVCPSRAYRKGQTVTVQVTEVTSGAFLDNPESRAVSRKVGYVENGRVRLKRRDTRAVIQQLLLTPEALVRPPHAVEVDGVAGVRRLLGIDEPAA